ncbi:MAG: citramalate synthase [Hyphomicrobiales bacterium]|nr:citramalate synthase [Hyphomicrobiales bacterium]
MKKENIFIFDTTLRDGNQTPGIDFTVEDKQRISIILDDLGVDYIEGGYPGANPTDNDFFSSAPKLANSKFVSFGMTKRPGRSISNDSGFKNLIAYKTDAICFVAKSWDFHVEKALGCSLDENITSINESVSKAITTHKEVMVDCEHFFDGYKNNKSYAKECVKAAYDSGARWVVLCDTNGGTLPHELKEIVEDICLDVPGANLGIHAHNDTGNAIANSLAAIIAGVRQIQGTMNGIGERCGNADLISIIPTLILKETFNKKFNISVSNDSLKDIRKTSLIIDDIINRAPNKQAPYVGDSAFSTKAGIHASAIVKDPKTYEHVDPLSIGNERKLLISDQGGKSNIMATLNDIGIEIKKDDQRIAELLNIVKKREAVGYTYESAHASFELLSRHIFGKETEFFKVESFRTMVERRNNAKGQLITVSEATVKIELDGERYISSGEGNGPINALDNALRKDLGKYNKYLSNMQLVDYKVRVLSGGTGGVTRVLVESSDSKTNERWVTIGVSSNIVDASFQALFDAINYKLVHSKAINN